MAEKKKKKITTIEELIAISSSELMHQADDIIIGANTLTDEHKNGLKLAAEFMRSHGLEEAAHDMLYLYNMEVIPTFPIENSEWANRMKDAGVAVNVQGYMKVGEGKDAIRYPIIMMSGDIMRYEIMFQKLKHDLKNELQNEDN